MSRHQFARWYGVLLLLLFLNLHLQQGECQEVETLENSIGMQFRLIPAGKFIMGNEGNGPAHEVTLTQPYYLGVYEVTQAQYEAVMKTNPSGFQGQAVGSVDSSNHPVEKVSWDDAVEFCRILSSLPEEKAVDRTYRLPTEAEWEHAARAGTTTEFFFGDDRAQLGDFAWHLSNGEKTTHPVGQKRPNPWGLYDIYGNVEEWCQDHWLGLGKSNDTAGDYPAGPATDPTGPAKGLTRIRRGGGWIHYPSVCCSAFRAGSPPQIKSRTLGFRVASVITKTPNQGDD